MDAILTRTGNLPAAKAPDRQGRVATRLLRMLSAVAYRAAERLTSPQRDVSPDFFRFPPF
jgi:hypothetical protein